jgi:Gas vesicle synthesis protein GvpO
MSERAALSMPMRMRKVREQLHELTGCEPVSISGLAQVNGGWQLEVDVVEVRRVPDTASVLATYRVTTDEAGDVAGYERLRRYNRGRVSAPDDAPARGNG